MWVIRWSKIPVYQKIFLIALKCSLNPKTYMWPLRILLGALNYKFDVIAISESKLKTNPQVDISLNGYHWPYCTFTEAEKGGTILYVSSDLNYKPKKDLEIYESKLLESCFIKLGNKKESNDIVGVMYRHPSMDQHVYWKPTNWSYAEIDQRE